VIAHGDSLERLATAQQFAVDLADCLQDLAGSVIVGQELRCLRARLLWHVIHLRPQARVAHRQIILGAMARAVGAFASRLAASFVALDKGAAQDGLEWGQLAQNGFAAFSQGGRKLFLYVYQTTYTTGLIVNWPNTFFNLFV
jgi:hypothetical protein